MKIQIKNIFSKFTRKTKNLQKAESVGCIDTESLFEFNSSDHMFQNSAETSIYKDETTSIQIFDTSSLALSVTDLTFQHDLMRPSRKTSFSPVKTTKNSRKRASIAVSHFKTPEKAQNPAQIPFSELQTERKAHEISVIQMIHLENELLALKKERRKMKQFRYKLQREHLRMVKSIFYKNGDLSSENNTHKVFSLDESNLESSQPLKMEYTAPKSTKSVRKPKKILSKISLKSSSSGYNSNDSIFV